MSRRSYNKKNNNNNSKVSSNNVSFDYHGESYSVAETVCARSYDNTWYLTPVLEIRDQEIMIKGARGFPKAVSLAVPDHTEKRLIAKSSWFIHADLNRFVPSTKRFSIGDVWSIQGGIRCTVTDRGEMGIALTTPDLQIIQLSGNALIDHVDQCVQKAQEPGEELKQEQAAATRKRVSSVQIEVLDENNNEKECGVCGFYYDLDSCILCWIQQCLLACQKSKTQRVAIESEEEWYTGTIKAVEFEGRGVKVHYLGFGYSHDEWIQDYFRRVSVFVAEHFEPLQEEYAEPGDLQIKAGFKALYDGLWNEIARATTVLSSGLADLCDEPFPRALPAKKSKTTAAALSPEFVSNPDHAMPAEDEIKLDSAMGDIDNNNTTSSSSQAAMQQCPHSRCYQPTARNYWKCRDCWSLFEGLPSGSINDNRDTAENQERMYLELLEQTGQQHDQAMADKKRIQELEAELARWRVESENNNNTKHNSEEEQTDEPTLLDQVLQQELVVNGPCDKCRDSPDLKLYDSDFTATRLCNSCFACIAGQQPSIVKVVYLNNVQPRSVNQLLSNRPISNHTALAKPSEFLSFTNYYKVEKLFATQALVRDLRSKKSVLVALDGEFFKSCEIANRVYREEILASQNQLAVQLRSCKSDVFTVCWNASLLQQDLQDYIDLQGPIQNLEEIFDARERIVTGILTNSHQGKDLLGFTLIIDLECQRMKPVNNASIKWLIHSGVKYTAMP